MTADKKKAQKIKESEIEEYLVHTAVENGFLCMKFHTANNGVPDRILIGCGLIFFIETKRPKGKARELQRQQMQIMARHGATSLVLDTKEKIDELFSYIKGNKDKLRKLQKTSNSFWDVYANLQNE